MVAIVSQQSPFPFGLGLWPLVGLILVAIHFESSLSFSTRDITASGWFVGKDHNLGFPEDAQIESAGKVRLFIVIFLVPKSANSFESDGTSPCILPVRCWCPPASQ